MKDRISVIIMSVILISMTFLSSCTPESCLEETESSLEASFYSYSSKNPQTPDSLTSFGLGMDTSRIYSAATGVRFARLPLNPDTLSSVFTIKINGVADTLSLFHTSYPHLISRECGYAFYHNIDSVQFTNNGIDSIWIRNTVVTTTDEENIRIFY